MMVSAYITHLRRRFGDLPQKRYDKRTGDGSSTIFQLSESPVVEGSYSLLIGGVQKSPGVSADYTIDLDTGDIELAEATSAEIEVTYKSAAFRDQWWLDSIQSGIRAMGDEFFRSVTRSPSAITLSAGVTVYDCPTGCIRLTEALESDDYTASGNFRQLGTNHSYDRRGNKLILGNKPLRANRTQISFLRRINMPQSTTATLDLEENWLEMLDKKCGAYYGGSRAMILSQKGNMSVEEGHVSVQGLRQLAKDNENEFQLLKRRNKPIMPSYAIPYYIPGGGETRTP